MPEFDISVGTRIPVISDTHGLLRPEAITRLEGAPLILHAGDVDRQYIMDELTAIAPTVVVRATSTEGRSGTACRSRKSSTSQATASTSVTASRTSTSTQQPPDSSS